MRLADLSHLAFEHLQLMRALRRTVGARIGLPAFRWMLEPAMRVLGTESELVLKSRWVAPGVLEETGFAFAHPRLDEALADGRLHRAGLPPSRRPCRR